MHIFATDDQGISEDKRRCRRIAIPFGLGAVMIWLGQDGHSDPPIYAGEVLALAAAGWVAAGGWRAFVRIWRREMGRD